MNTSYPTKNNLPWTSIYQFPNPVNSDLFSALQQCWQEEDWGENFQNNKRDPAQAAIYPCTRRVEYDPTRLFSNKKLEAAIVNVAEEIKTLFTVSMSLLWAELTLLVPNGTIRWHHDRLANGIVASKVMIPLTDNSDVKNYFCSWTADTPTDRGDFNPVPHLSDDLYEVEMKSGFYYVFNHRIPHKTVSKSSAPRGMLALDMIPTEYTSIITENLGPITEFEKIKLLPPHIC